MTYPNLPYKELIRQLVKDHGATWTGTCRLQLPFGGSPAELSNPKLPVYYYDNGVSVIYPSNPEQDQ